MRWTKTGVLTLLLVTLGTARADEAAAPAKPTPASFRLKGARIVPKRAFVGARPVRIRFRFRADGPLELRLQIIRLSTRKVVRAYVLPGALPARVGKVRWDGLGTHGKAQPDGRYRVRIAAVGARPHRAGSFVLHSHFFPVRGPHGARGAIGQFGASRNGGRTHEGFDVVAACGTPIAAARAGKVRKNTYDPVLYGNLLIVRGLKSHRDYWYAHLRSRSKFKRGAKVRTGQQLGLVGDTGNARSVGCHLHFEIHSHGRPIDPEPELREWDGWS